MPSEPTDPGQDFRLAVRRAALELLEDSAMEERSHPDVDDIVAYQESRLEAAESEAIRAHLEDCADCRREIEALVALGAEGLDDPDLLPDPETVAADWDRLQARLGRGAAERTDPSETLDEPLSVVDARPRRPWAPALLAASLAVAAVGVAAWLAELWNHGEAPQVVAAFEQPLFAELVPDGEELRRSAEPPTLEPAAGTDVFVLRLLTGDVAPRPSYRVEIRGDDGQRVWYQEQLTRQPKGDFLILVPSRDLPAGRYRLVLEAGEPGDERPIATYSFEVAVRD